MEDSDEWTVVTDAAPGRRSKETIKSDTRRVKHKSNTGSCKAHIDTGTYEICCAEQNGRVAGIIITSKRVKTRRVGVCDERKRDDWLRQTNAPTESETRGAGRPFCSLLLKRGTFFNVRRTMTSLLTSYNWTAYPKNHWTQSAEVFFSKAEIIKMVVPSPAVLADYISKRLSIRIV